jgi:hypothetical protein
MKIKTHQILHEHLKFILQRKMSLTVSVFYYILIAAFRATFDFIYDCST